MDLHAKADVVSAWCLIMGVKISHAKFRTFGMDWGTKKKVEGKLIIHTEGWTEVLVDVRSDGVLTHLGMIWNTDMNNKELWNGIVEKVQDMGWRISRTCARTWRRLWPWPVAEVWVAAGGGRPRRAASSGFVEHGQAIALAVDGVQQFVVEGLVDGDAERRADQALENAAARSALATSRSASASSSGVPKT